MRWATTVVSGRFSRAPSPAPPPTDLTPSAVPGDLSIGRPHCTLVELLAAFAASVAASCYWRSKLCSAHFCRPEHLCHRLPSTAPANLHNQGAESAFSLALGSGARSRYQLDFVPCRKAFRFGSGVTAILKAAMASSCSACPWPYRA